MIVLNAAMWRANPRSSRVAARTNDHDGSTSTSPHHSRADGGERHRLADEATDAGAGQASTTATLPETIVATLSIQKRARKLMDLLSSALCTTLGEPTRNVTAIATVSSVSRGSW